MALLWYAKTRGFKVGCVLFRNAKGIPITSYKLNYPGSFDDLNVVLENVHKKYVADVRKQNKRYITKKRTRLYLYGCSLGASLIGLYLVNFSKRASEIVDGVALLSTPWDLKAGEKRFYSNFRGFYPWVFGLALSAETRTCILPQMKPYLSEKMYQHYDHALKTNWQGMDHLNRKVYQPMFGFENHEQYLDHCTVAGRMKLIKVPTFALAARDDQVCDD